MVFSTKGQVCYLSFLCHIYKGYKTFPVQARVQVYSTIPFYQVKHLPSTNNLLQKAMVGRIIRCRDDIPWEFLFQPESPSDKAFLIPVSLTICMVRSGPRRRKNSMKKAKRAINRILPPPDLNNMFSIGEYPQQTAIIPYRHQILTLKYCIAGVHAEPDFPAQRSGLCPAYSSPTTTNMNKKTE